MSRWQGIGLLALLTLVQSIRPSNALPASPTQDITQSSTSTQPAHVTVKVELHGSVALPSFGSLPLDQVAKVLPFMNTTELSGEAEPGGAINTPNQYPPDAHADTDGAGTGDPGDCPDGHLLSSVSAMAAVSKTQTVTEYVDTVITTTTTITLPTQSAPSIISTPASFRPTTDRPSWTPSPYTQTFTKSKSKTTQSVKSSQTVTSWTQVFQPTSQAQSTKTSTTRSSTSSKTTTSTSTKSTVTQQSSGSGKLTQWDQGVLDQHNSFRARYKAPPLTWDATLATTAMQWAERCEWKHDPALGPLKQGQNMDSAASSNGKAGLTPEAVLKHWVTAEVNDYDPNNPQASHFTQVVWKGTTRVGCASVSCNLSMYDPSWWPASFVVCNYAEPGNMAGQYAANVQL